MKDTSYNKRKIFNDPVYGFVTIPGDLIFDIIEHPYFQRLRRIEQLGLTHLIYPGALHTRFHHSLGAMYLMQQAINSLREKNIEITKEEAQAVSIAILLHDIGHGPYSHTLENSIVAGISHEYLSKLYMERLNKYFDGKLKKAIAIFNNTYEKKFLHQLISSQLDMDRLDYLRRDSYFTGVSEGVVSSNRIIKMLDVIDDNLVVEAKGIYSIEKFIIARRLMYWQVYLHKTVLSAEYLLRRILSRAKELSENGELLFASPAFGLFLRKNFSKEDFLNDPVVLNNFSKLDDFDIYSSIKTWIDSDDFVLSELSKSLINRRLLKIEIQETEFEEAYIDLIKEKVLKKLNLKNEEVNYFVFSDKTSNYAYDPYHGQINILYKNGKIMDIADASDQLNISVLSNPVVKHFLCYPKFIKS